MVRLSPNRSKLPPRRMIIYILIVLMILMAMILWDRLAGFLM
jgi:hypothetical protein